MFGYQGKFLRVDLSKAETNLEEADTEGLFKFFRGTRTRSKDFFCRSLS
ncbi:hypothetical protein DMNBHIDG_01918 [Candidatus Methanoperedenaceae archaeon GB37]|nr:hypothetical protein DMNBHIDG_01918 [Candidatus Methanoperedenaceae archaeon GB37]